ncbi:unnamed protein product, partial [Scytosiphon promiscuus]
LKTALGSKTLYQHKRIERELRFIQRNYDTYIDERNFNYIVLEL